jgi:hypothetical protein
MLQVQAAQPPWMRPRMQRTLEAKSIESLHRYFEQLTATEDINAGARLCTLALSLSAVAP